MKDCPVIAFATIVVNNEPLFVSSQNEVALRLDYVLRQRSLACWFEHDDRLNYV
jgi:hypothetical protein